MKKSSLIILALFMLPFVSADLVVDDVRGYVNNERQSNIDDGGGTFYTVQKDVVDIIIEMSNSMNTSTKVKLYLKIDDIDSGSDLIKQQSWFTIDANEQKSKMLSLDIPVEAVIQSYDAALNITVEYSNGTTSSKKIDYEFVVRKPTTDTQVALQSYFANLTTICGNVTSNLGTMFNYVNQFMNCSSELSSVKEERGSYKSDYENVDLSYKQCQQDKTSAEQARQTCENDKKTMMSLADHERLLTEAVNEESSSKTQIMLMAAAAIAAFWYWNNRKKKNETVQDNYYYNKK